ncbi:hypothetical protein DB30_04584 [Enhygromyxa salina]|uniref:Uncharacterized protein n=1 Tax=Enhygromyxa salina TaxID=215803 RepID=A0A0C1ZNR2_9BACT|nr:hypothetical protein [Enhygromyxa salina]KIG19119.1 hypothetical protein DB30_04584 [Enhygromyxa salina]
MLPREFVVTELLIASLLASAPVIHDLRVRWVGEAQCQGGQRVVERLELLAPEISVTRADTPANVTATVTIRRDPAQQWSVGLELVGPLGVERRSFVAETCAVAIDATALVLAVSIDPIGVSTRVNREAAAPEPDPQPDPQPPSAPPVTDERPSEPATTSDVRREPSVHVSNETRADRTTVEFEPRGPVGFGLAALAGGGYGPLQAGSATVMGRLAAFGPHWRVELRGAWLPPVRPALGDRGRARVDGFLIGALGCGVLQAGPVEFPLCAGIEAGAIRGRALAPIPNAEVAAQPYVGVMLGPGLSWAPIERVALGLELQAQVRLASGGFALDDLAALNATPVGVRALAGVEIRFP